MITTKQELLDFYILRKDEIMKNCSNHITYKMYDLRKEDLIEMSSEIYIRLHRLKKVKPNSEKYYMNYFHVMWNNLFNDYYSTKKRITNLKIPKHFTNYSLDNVYINEILISDDPEIELNVKQDKNLNYYNDPRTILLISFLERLFNKNEVDTIIYFISSDQEENNYIKVREKLINMTKTILDHFLNDNEDEQYENEFKELINSIYKKIVNKKISDKYDNSRTEAN
jgi:hypothetical protein